MLPHTIQTSRVPLMPAKSIQSFSLSEPKCPSLSVLHAGVPTAAADRSTSPSIADAYPTPVQHTIGSNAQYIEIFYALDSVMKVINVQRERDKRGAGRIHRQHASRGFGHRVCRSTEDRPYRENEQNKMPSSRPPRYV